MFVDIDSARSARIILIVDIDSARSARIILIVDIDSARSARIILIVDIDSARYWKKIGFLGFCFVFENLFWPGWTFLSRIKSFASRIDNKGNQPRPRTRKKRYTEPARGQKFLATNFFLRELFVC